MSLMKKPAIFLYFSLYVISCFAQNREVNHKIKNDYVKLGQIDSFLTTKKQILNEPQLFSKIPNWDVAEFNICVQRNTDKKNLLGPYRSVGYTFTQIQIAIIKSLNDSDKIYITDIKLKSANQEFVVKDNITLQIKKSTR